MKTIEEVRAECEYGEVMTTKEFCQEVANGFYNSFDGRGRFHDGEKETNVRVWDRSLTWDDIKKYPYVCWYNK